MVKSGGFHSRGYTLFDFRIRLKLCKPGSKHLGLAKFRGQIQRASLSEDLDIIIL